MAIHGTSEQALRVLLRTGYYPKNYSSKGIFAHPTRTIINGRVLVAQSAAQRIAMEEFSIKHTGQNYLTVMEWGMAIENDTELDEEDLARFNISKKMLRESFDRNSHRRGFVIGISEELEQFVKPVSHAENEEILISVNWRPGIHFPYIVSIYAAGPEERHFLERLKQTP